jgi:phosphoribosyl 1,2-cyclic phosphodiesterase
MMASEFGRGKGAASIFLTHTYWPHIQGIPFFAPFYIKGNRFNIYSPVDNIQERVEYQQALTHFPVAMDSMMAAKRFFQVKEDESFYINDTKIFTKSMPQPGSACGIRVENSDGVFVYTSDCEFGIDEMDYIHSYDDLFRDADLLVFDAQYRFQEPGIDRMAQGDSSAEIAVDIAMRNNVKRLILVYHDPWYDDEKLDSVLFNARAYLDANRTTANQLTIDLACEGMVFNINTDAE